MSPPPFPAPLPPRAGARSLASKRQTNAETPSGWRFAQSRRAGVDQCGYPRTPWGGDRLCVGVPSYEPTYLIEVIVTARGESSIDDKPTVQSHPGDFAGRHGITQELTWQNCH